MVLGEVTAFADPGNEMLIQKTSEVLTRRKTVLIIAHRLSAVQGTDRILVLEGGVMAEDDTHWGLSEQKGVYAAMWKDY